MATPNEQLQWMLFVDGENLTLRAQALAAANGKIIGRGDSYRQDVYVWLNRRWLGDVYQELLMDSCGTFNIWPVRSYYYTSYVGDDDLGHAIRRSLRKMAFDPQVFKRDRGRAKSKGVDIALTKDLLSHAFLDNYDAAVLVAGDADYLPLVEEVKRRGKIMLLCFLEGQDSGLSENLRLAADFFRPLNSLFERYVFAHPSVSG